MAVTVTGGFVFLNLGTHKSVSPHAAKSGMGQGVSSRLSKYSEVLVPLALLRDWHRMDWGYMLSAIWDAQRVAKNCVLLMCGPRR